MVKTIVARVIAVSLAFPAHGAAGEPVEETTFHDLVVLDRTEGAVWLRQPLVYLGMVGISAFSPRYRLSPEVSSHLGPLVTRVEEREAASDGGVEPWIFGLPRAEGPIILLRLETRARLAGVEPDTPRKTWEVVFARVLSAEILPPEWRRAWESLEGALREVVRESLEAPGAAKRKRLEAAASDGSAALAALGRARPADELRTRLDRVAPEARASHAFSRRVGEEWGTVLRSVIATLGLETSPPIPAAPEPCPALEILLESGTPRDFAERLAERCGEEGLDERLFWSSERGGVVRASDLTQARVEDYPALKDEARKALEDRAKWEAERAKVEPPPDAWEVPEWGVELARLEPSDCARLLVIRGARVVAVRDGGSPVDLERGDVIPGYGSAGDLLMHPHPKEFLDRRARQEGQLRILRGGSVVTLERSKPGAAPGDPR